MSKKINRSISVKNSITNEEEISKNIINDNNNNISKLLVEQRNERQEHNNKLAYDAIKSNPKKTNDNNINDKALDRLLTYTNYNNLDEMIKDKNNHEEIIIKISSLYIAKNASRQGTKDEDLQLENINKLHEYDITIIKDGKQKPIKGGGIRKSGKKQADELKSIDFVIKYKNEEIGYITAKVTSGGGGHQDNVLDEITQFCDWSLIQQQNDIQEIKQSLIYGAHHKIENNFIGCKQQKVYIVLYDSMNTSKLFNDIKKKYKNTNLILTDTKKFKNDFLNWFYNKNK
jgi:hypothetical protein